MAKKQEEEKALTPVGSFGAMEPAPDFAQDSNAGLEKIGSQDLAWPRAMLIQKTSKLLEDRNANVRFGDVINDLTGEKICDPETEVDIVPFFHFKSWIEWADLDDGGGVVRASLDEKSDVAMDFVNQKRNASGGLLVTEYHNFLCLLPDRKDDSGKPQVVLVPMSKTSHKTGKKLIMLARMRGKALYAGRYTLSTKQVNKGDKGWVEFTIENATDKWVRDRALYDLAQKLHEDAKASAAQMDALAVAARAQNDSATSGEDATPGNETKW